MDTLDSIFKSVIFEINNSLIVDVVNKCVLTRNFLCVGILT